MKAHIPSLVPLDFLSFRRSRNRCSAEAAADVFIDHEFLMARSRQRSSVAFRKNRQHRGTAVGRLVGQLPRFFIAPGKSEIAGSVV